MSGRCKSCDSILEEWEMKMVDPSTQRYTELCSVCIVDEFIEDDLLQLDLDLLSKEDTL